MRMAWADVARGGAMILVVLAHALQLMAAYGWENGWLDTANLYLTALRMPLFFLVSGLFAVRAIQRSWRGLFASRLALLLYMYALWMVVRTVWFTFVPWPLDSLEPWLSLLVAPVWPSNGLWFLYALMLYLVLGKLTARLAPAIVLVPLAALAVVAASGVIPDLGGAWSSIALYAFFFVLGARLPGVWTAVADRANVWWLIVGLAAIAASVLGFGLVPDALRGAARVVLSIVCVAGCLVVAALLVRVRPVAAPLRYVGERTLAIYVVHTMLLAALVPLVPAGVMPSALMAVALVAVGVVVPLLLRSALAGFSGVFDLPRPWARRLARYAERAGRDAGRD